MKKFLSLTLVILLSLVVLTGCGGSQQATNEEQSQEETDVVTTASIVKEEQAFQDAISTDGTWIVATLNDLTFDQELVVEGTFHDKGNSDNEVYRKLAPYSQDDNHNITERYTITAPKMTIKSPNTKFQGGTFVGDVYVQANGFTLEDATVEGNIYFATEEYKSSANITDKSEVTGSTEVKGATDVVSAASIVKEEKVFKKAIAKDGKWIIATLNDLSFDEELVVAGTFHDKGNSNNKVYRKIAPYTQDDNYNVTERFTISAPKMTIKSPNTKFQAGTFVGDVYVQANGFTLEDATVEGNIYFATEEYKSSANITDKSEVTGTVNVK